VETQELAGGELLVDERPVGDESKRGLGRFGARGEVVSVDEHAACRRLEQAGDHPDRRRLPSAVRAQEPVNLSRLDLEATLSRPGTP
jgi:hypothetical protein